MKRFIGIVAVAVGFCAAFFGHFSAVEGQEMFWVQILDSQAVTFSQLSPADPNSFVSDWQTGEVTIDYNRLSQDGFAPGGFIQIVQYDPANPSSSDAFWVVQNIPVYDPAVLDATSVAYTYPIPTSGPIASTTIAAFYAAGPRPLPQPQKPPPGNNNQKIHPPAKMPPNKQNPPIAPIIPIILPGITGLPLFPGNPTKALQPIDNNRTDKQDPLTKEPGVEEEFNQCAPGSVANSLEYIKNQFKNMFPALKLDDGLTNNPSTTDGTGMGKKDPTSRVGALDTAMKRGPNLPTPMQSVLQGKLNYIMQKMLDIATKSQGVFCNANRTNCQNLLGTEKDKKGNSGATPDHDFLTKELMDQEDVEMCFQYATGAHCVQVIGYRWVNGFLSLQIRNDNMQGKKGGVTAADKGFVDLKVGKDNKGALWIENFNGVPAKITHLITESPKRPQK